MTHSDIVVGLIPHVGVQATPLGPVQVEHDQWIIWAARRGEGELQVGYVGKKPGSPINFLRQPNGQPWPELIKQAVRDYVAAELGAGDRRESQPPPPSPPEPEEWDDDEDEGEEVEEPA